MTKCGNDIESGLMAIKELLKLKDGVPRLHIFSTCTSLIHSLQNILSSTANPNVTANEPHDITHALDALRYFATFYFYPPKESLKFDLSTLRKDILEDYYNSPMNVRKMIEEKYGTTDY